MMCCPFHADSTPSLKIYHDHFHCFGCGAHGDRIDWLMAVEGLSRAEAIHLIKNWDGPITPRRRTVSDDAIKRASALRLWEAGPADRRHARRSLSRRHPRDRPRSAARRHRRRLRFHPRCPFGPGMRHPCLLALMRDAVDRHADRNPPHRARRPSARKIDRRMLGSSGVVKLWPAGTAAGRRRRHRDRARRRHADSLPTTNRCSRLGPRSQRNMLGGFPVLTGVERLIILVDHDEAGLAAAATCAERWTRAGRTVVQLTPERPGDDFNDLVMQELAL